MVLRLELEWNEVVSVSYCQAVFRVSLQLDLITDLLGTPSLEAMRTACEGAKAHILRGPHKQVKRQRGDSLSLSANCEGRTSIAKMLLIDTRHTIDIST